MSPASTMIPHMSAHLITDVHSPYICAFECQCPLQTGLRFHAVLQLLSGDGFPSGLSRFPLRSASCL
jgi:hypothetical protein